VAVAHKLANPEAIVVSYQGDGDLASIGLAEIVSTAQAGVPISVVFVNNATYGMTGGQMAPTTLPGQRSTTTPEGRPAAAGMPMRMAELIAKLDGPVYVERVALYDSKQQMRAKKAIRKALEVQAAGRGFAFVEVLAECPTHLGRTPDETSAWVRDEMTKYFPLGLLKDEARAPLPPPAPPLFDGELLADLAGAEILAPPRFAAGFPRHLSAGDLALKFAGAGGDGAQTAALLVARAAIAEGFDATHIPSYGPESRGGTSYADVRLSEHEVITPAVPEPDVLVAFNAPSLAKFGPMVREGGTVIYDSTVAHDPPALAAGVRALGVPLTGIARELGRPVIKNVVALGALQAATGIFPEATFLNAIREALARKRELVPVNEEAFRRGAAAISVNGDVAAAEPATV
jgi:2-oxoisovalerate ferredoxin oxidoreductase beta subunit